MRIQAVWDSGETDRLREFLTDDLIVELKPQLAERGGAANKTEVVLLNAELLGIETVSDGHLASVRFSGMLREAPAPRPSASRSLEPVQAGQRRLVAGRHPADPGRLRQLSLTSAAPIRTALAVRSQSALLGRFFHVRAQSHATPRPVTLRLAHCKNRQPRPWPLPIAFMLPLPFLPTPSRLATQALNMLLKREDWARERLVRHAGKTVRFALGGFSLSLTIGSDGLAELSDPAVVPDVTLTVSPENCRCRAVRRSGAGHGRGHAYFRRRGAGPGGGRPVQAVALGSRRRAGARGGRHRRALRLVGGARRLAGGSLQAGQRAAENVSEYLAEESGLLLEPSGAGAMAPGPGRSWTRAPRRWRGPPPFCRRNWPPLA